MIDKLIEYNIIKTGEFVLKSGESSHFYINLKEIISYPKLHKMLCDNIIQKINVNTDLIVGTPYGAVPFASYISIEKEIPMLFLRKQPKSYGTKKLIEGIYEKGQNVVLLEDVITTGQSVIETAEKLEQHGLKVIQIISVISRSKNKNLKYKDISIEYLYHLD